MRETIYGSGKFACDDIRTQNNNSSEIENDFWDAYDHRMSAFVECDVIRTENNNSSEIDNDFWDAYHRISTFVECDDFGNDAFDWED